MLLYTDEVWKEWCSEVEENFEIKKYLHFDSKFDFPANKEKIREIVSNPDEQIKYAFLPLVKSLLKHRATAIRKKRKSTH